MHLRRRDLKRLRKRLRQAEPLIDAALSHEIQRSGDLGVHEALRQTFLPWIAGISDPIQQSLFSRK